MLLGNTLGSCEMKDCARYLFGCLRFEPVIVTGNTIRIIILNRSLSGNYKVLKSLFEFKNTGSGQIGRVVGRPCCWHMRS